MNHEIDLSIGDVRSCTTGEVHSRLVISQNKRTGKRVLWRRRERTLATEMYLATVFGSGSIHLLDLALLWPDWFVGCHSLQHIRKRFDPFRCAINHALNKYGWAVELVGVKRWALHSYEGKHLRMSCSISATRAVQPLRAAEAFVNERNYRGALIHAVEALHHCHESHHARMIVGMCRFCHNEPVDLEIASDTASAVLEYERNLSAARDKLSELWRKQDRRRDHWAFVEDFIRQCEERLTVYQPLFEKARTFLMGGDDVGDQG